mmetsp:Transcript_42450/g.101544  ORF Transcript_42450/g.101544 Transcript_42450/m.101544 type:complete len:287 (+) Transcript_42450:110-970(+)
MASVNVSECSSLGGSIDEHCGVEAEDRDESTIAAQTSAEVHDADAQAPGPDGEVEAESQTPEADVGSTSVGKLDDIIMPTIAPKERAKSALRIQEFRQKQLHCMDTLRQQVRVHACEQAMRRQSSEPVGKQVGGVHVSGFHLGPLGQERPFAADPLVMMVQSISSKQCQTHHALLTDLNHVRQEVSAQRQEMRGSLRRHAAELAELQKGTDLSAVKTLAVALGAALGLLAARHCDFKQQSWQTLGGYLTRHTGGSSCVLLHTHRSSSTLSMSMPHAPRRARRSSRQ